MFIPEDGVTYVEYKTLQLHIVVKNDHFNTKLCKKFFICRINKNIVRKQV